MARRRRELDDDEDDDERLRKRGGVLRDGESFRVPMMMRDGSPHPWLTDVQRSVAAHSRGLRLHDGRGGPAGHRPGFVYSTDTAGRDAVGRARAEYDQRICDAWKGPNPHELEVKPLTGDAREDARRARIEADNNAWRGPANSGKW